MDPTTTFDFWPGRWHGDGTTVTVYSLLGGSLLLEERTREDATVAMAMTFYDPVGSAWTRREVTADGQVGRLAGTPGEDGVALAGTLAGRDGSRTSLRVSFSHPDGGSVSYARETGDEGDPTTATVTEFERTGGTVERPEPTARRVPGSHESVAARPPERRFDFWVGEWDVHGEAGSKVGDSVVERRLDGALLVENWTGRGGSRGHSFNYYDAAAAAWTQTWLAADGGWLEITGGFDDGAMRLVGTQYGPYGGTEEYRGVWTPDPDGSVTQALATSDDGESWTVGFVGDYRPAE